MVAKVGKALLLCLDVCGGVTIEEIRGQVKDYYRVSTPPNATRGVVYEVPQDELAATLSNIAYNILLYRGDTDVN